MIKLDAFCSNSVDVSELTSDELKTRDVPQSTAVGLPKSFKVPDVPRYVELKYKNLKDADGKAVKPSLGVIVLTGDAYDKEQPIGIGSITRTYFDNQPAKSEEGDGFITAGESRTAAIDTLQDVTAYNMRPSEVIDKLKGKTFKTSFTKDVFVPTFNEKRKIIAYTGVSKDIYSVV